MKVFSQSEWEAARKKGKPAFLLRYGFLERGIPLGLAVALLIEFGAYDATFPGFLSSPGFWGRLAFAIGVFTATGVMNATLNWNLHEKRFPSGV
jgi:hypothetical protein